ncbi:MAG: hypothetical protein JWR07_1959 [Nevskia sp.]|nr:hypothetical protein [Nevskia sp.]
MSLTFDELSHTYTFEGRTVPSVTQLLAPLSNLQMVDPAVLRAAADFGTAVHKACELDDLGELDEESLDPALGPYLSAWRKFSAEHAVKWTLIEGRMHNQAMGYAGTVDRYGAVRGDDAVVDLKSSAILYPTVGPQLAAYAKAIPGTTLLTKRIGVLLKPDGNYQAKTYASPMDWAVFASLITLRTFCSTHAITPNFKELSHV